MPFCNIMLSHMVQYISSWHLSTAYRPLWCPLCQARCTYQVVVHCIYSLYPWKKKISKFGPHGLTKKFYIYMMSCKNSFFFLAKRGLRQNEASTNTEYHVFTYIRFVSMTTFNTQHINVTIHIVLKYSDIKHASRCLIHKTIPCNSENSLEGVSLKQARKGKQ